MQSNTTKQESFESIRRCPDDGLPIMKVGSWAFEKHKLLADYVAASYGVRQKCSQSVLIDLYCGHGRVFDRAAPNDIRDGGTLVAYKKSLEGKRSYGAYQTVIIGDADLTALESCRDRLHAAGAKNVIALHGTAEETAEQAVARCPKYGLKLAYLDPYRPEDLPFSVLKTLSRLKMVDFIVHYGQMDITRNIDAEYFKPNSRFDLVAPGWKAVVKVDKMSPENARTRFLEYWASLMQNLGFQHARQMPLMTVDINNAPLYRLVLFSGHPLASTLWNDIAKPAQGSLDFEI